MGEGEGLTVQGSGVMLLGVGAASGSPAVAAQSNVQLSLGAKGHSSSKLCVPSTCFANLPSGPQGQN